MKTITFQSVTTMIFMIISAIGIALNFNVLFDNEFFLDLYHGNHQFRKLDRILVMIITFCISLIYLFIMISLNVHHHVFCYLFLFLCELVLTFISFFSGSVTYALLSYFHVMSYIDDNSNDKIHYYKLILNGDVNPDCHYSEMNSDDKKHFVDDSLSGIKMNDKFEMEIIEKINNQEIPTLLDIENKISQGESKEIDTKNFINVRLKLIGKINSQIKLLNEHINKKKKETNKKKKIAFENSSNLKEIKEFIDKL